MRAETIRAALARHRHGPVDRLWTVAHLLAARLAFRALRPPGRSALYTVGSFAEGEAVPGLSDLDLFVVTPDAGGASRRRLYARWKRVAARLPRLARHIDVRISEQSELRAAVRSAPSNAPEGDPPPMALAAPADRDPGWLRVRPGPFEPLSSWRLLTGPDRRPAPLAAPAREAIAWAELDVLWRHAFELVAGPGGTYAPYMAVKLVADSARAWLWLEHGERVASRPAALRRALDLAPEDEGPLRSALRVHARLGSRDTVDLAGALEGLIRFSERVAATIAGTPGREVTLTGARGVPLPLADWKGLVLPGGMEDRVAPVAGDPADPGAVAAAISAHSGRVWPALRRGDLVVLPAVQPPGERAVFARHRPVLRCVKCPATDPVVFALLARSPTALFTGVRGFSADELARRAVAEHRAWRAGGGDDASGLLSAARAGLFAAGLQDGSAELLLDEAAVIDRLGLARGDNDVLAASADQLLGPE